MVWLPDGEIMFMTCLAVWTQYRHETDGQTDKQTERQSCNGIVRTMHTPRVELHDNKWYHSARRIKPTPTPLQVLPFGKFNGMIPEPLALVVLV